MIAEYQALERISKLCALLASSDVRFSRVGRRAEDLQEQRRVLLDAAGFDLDRPYCDTATIYGRTYQLPDATAFVVREIAAQFDPVRVEHVGDDTIGITDPNSEMVSLPVALRNTPTPEEEMMMPTPTTDPNAALNGGSPAPAEPTGFLAKAKEYCTLRNGLIATAVAIVGTAVYLAVSTGDSVPETPVA